MLGEAGTKTIFLLKILNRAGIKSFLSVNMSSGAGTKKIFLLKILNGAGIKNFF